jgi:hypothetical protein
MPAKNWSTAAPTPLAGSAKMPSSWSSCPCSAESDDACPYEPGRDVEHALGVGHPEVTDDVRTQQDRHVVFRTTGPEPVEHGFDRPVPVVAEASGMVGGAEHGLGVADAVVGEIRAELLGDPFEVLEPREDRAHLPVVVDEVPGSVEAPAVVV